jgi:hypothetical protein
MRLPRLQEVELPEFGVPDVRPELPRSLYRDRLDAFLTAKETAGFDAIIVYADREHCANFSYLTGFDPRFEEALLVVVDGHVPAIITGPENQGPAAASMVEVEVVLYPPFGLMGQDRRRTPLLGELLRRLGLRAGATIGVLGWKYFGKHEADSPESWLETPAYIVDALRALVGPSGKVLNANGLLMDNSTGLRAVNEIDQLAQFEFSATHASEAVKSVLFGLKTGMREFDACRLMGLNGLPHSCHTMLSSGARTSIGLAGPSSKRIELGEPFTVAVGYWGALTCRAGWVACDKDDLPVAASDYVERVAAPYFACASEWYETIGIGVTGGELDALVRCRLGDSFFNLILNPGHLIHIDEWMNTPVYPGSEEHFISGQAVQCDIIPAVGAPYFTSNIEDGVALLDEAGRAELKDKYPGAWSRIEARRAFMADVLGIKLKAETLPFSNIPAYLPPYLLSPRNVLSMR